MSENKAKIKMASILKHPDLQIIKKDNVVII